MIADSLAVEKICDRFLAWAKAETPSVYNLISWSGRGLKDLADSQNIFFLFRVDPTGNLNDTFKTREYRGIISADVCYANNIGVDAALTYAKDIWGLWVPGTSYDNNTYRIRRREELITVTDDKISRLPMLFYYSIEEEV